LGLNGEEQAVDSGTSLCMDGKGSREWYVVVIEGLKELRISYHDSVF